MAVFKDTIITDAGKRLLAQALANRKQITFTKLETSDFDYKENNNIEEVINLAQVKQSINLSSIVQKGTFVTVKGVFTNRGLVNSYEIKTIGCFAKINDENEILYSITRVKTPDTMPAENGINLSTVEIELVTQINNESGAVIKYSPDTLVTKSTLATETNIGVVRYGTTESTALEGAKMAQIIGAEYGGLLQTPGQKEVGKAYYDSVNKQMVSPLENNTLTYYETTKFIPISGLQNANKVNNFNNFFEINTYNNYFTLPNMNSSTAKVFKIKNLAIVHITVGFTTMINNAVNIKFPIVFKEAPFVVPVDNDANAVSIPSVIGVGWASREGVLLSKMNGGATVLVVGEI